MVRFLLQDLPQYGTGDVASVAEDIDHLLHMYADVQRRYRAGEIFLGVPQQLLDKIDAIDFTDVKVRFGRFHKGLEFVQFE